MADGQLNVDLRLALSKLREDIAKAAKLIKEGLSKSINLGGADTKGAKEAGDAMDKLHIKTKRVNAALGEQLATWKKLQNFRKPVISIYGQTPMPKSDYSGYGPTMYPTQGPMGPGGSLATSAPYMGGTPPVIPVPPMLPKATPVAIPAISAQDAVLFWRRLLTGAAAIGGGSGAISRALAINQSIGALGQTQTGAAAMGRIGVSGIGGAAALTGVVIAVQLALKGLQKVIEETVAAGERARVLYAKATISGLGLQYTAKRSNIASVLGVSETDIYQFGAALAILEPRLRFASEQSAMAAQALAPLSYELRILKIDFTSLLDHLALDLAPTLVKIVNIIDSLVQIGNVWYEINKAIFQQIKDFLNSIPLAQVLFSAPLKALISSITKGAIKELPAPQAFMKQMPVSSLERMGLVAGISGNTMVDYARRTANATEKIAATLSSRPGSPSAHQRPFGIDPTTSNP